ncbi:carboxylesterase family protein [Corynebacterium sp. MSK041]|uniref:carboxylesterase family protein n=1 Tax=Corynebacterium sp. MSK041 TaxID=3050194 RepID=UPI00254D5A59|nr:carboxylesterase family protein [Corynebacterium sp. MSK041]MDK8794142.1 carboxylesterase family protein [Corynebacterium sp. MSK041]
MNSPVEVTCPAGTVVGVARGSTAYFHSIGYSHIPAPFDDAVPAEKGLLIDATRERPDAIALSIVAPAGATDADDLPVLVHIHGGRFEMGDHTDEASPGEALATNGVILVRIGYRMKLPGLAVFHDDQPHHFRAVDDVALGLEWVQKNIEAFGGDPTNVTLSGHSAGAAIVLWLMRKDHYRGAFRRAVALSPAFPRMSYAQRKSAIRAGAGIPLTRRALNRAKPKVLERAYRTARARYFTDMALGPTPLEPEEMADVDLVITTVEEEIFDSTIIQDKVRAGWFTMVLPGFLIGLKPGMYRPFLKRLKARNPKHVAGEFFSANLIRRWVDDVAQRAPGTVWQVELVSDSTTRARHCAELAPIFGAAPYPAGAGLNACLIHYVTTGEPGWTPYGAEKNVLRVDLSGNNAEIVTDPLGYLRGVFTRKS